MKKIGLILILSLLGLCAMAQDGSGLAPVVNLTEQLMVQPPVKDDALIEQFQSNVGYESGAAYRF